MQKLQVFILFTLLVTFGYNSVGQITIDQADMPSPGDTIRISTALNFEQYNFEETGEDFIWDFSNLVSISQQVDSFVAVNETPIYYWPFFIFSANLASPLVSDSPIPEIPLTDVFNFYNNSSSNYSDLGFAATLFSIPIPFKFDSPDIVYDFPMNYGNTDSSESGFNFGLENLGYILVERKRVNTVDGWGSLITPYGTFDVLRLKSEVYEYDSVYIDSVSMGIPVEREYTEYKWLAKGQKVPLLTVSTSLLGLVVNYVDSLQTETTNLPDQLIETDHWVRVFPNPVREVLNIELNNLQEGFVDVMFFDIQGNSVSSRKTILVNDRVHQIHLSEFILKPGTYFMQLSRNEFSVTKKIIFKP
jgi:hypothetical protein